MRFLVVGLTLGLLAFTAAQAAPGDYTGVHHGSVTTSDNRGDNHYNRDVRYRSDRRGYGHDYRRGYGRDYRHGYGHDYRSRWHRHHRHMVCNWHHHRRYCHWGW
jgi:hypothetical protein